MSVMFSSYFFLFRWSSEGNIEELLKTVLLHGKTRGEDIFQSFYTGHLVEINVQILKSVSITTDSKKLYTLQHRLFRHSLDKIHELHGDVIL